jgi:hypothetical protein
MPFLVSHHNRETLYAAGNKVLTSLDRGDHWREISPDLSTPAGGDRAVVPYGTITMIGESPIQPGLLYVGTEAGAVWVTKNNGTSWEKAGAGLPAKWVTRVIASQWDPATVYVAQSGYRTDDFTPYLYVSGDFGKTWRSIASNLPAECINVVREDPRNPNVLYAATDLGVYASLDRGGAWVSLASNLPSTPVEDLVVHPRDDEVVIGTHGRGVFVLDARPVQQWGEATKNGLRLFAPRPLAVRDADDIEPSRKRAEERLLFYLQSAQPLTIEITDADRHVVRRIAAQGRQGLNVAVWDGQIEDRSSPGGGWDGPVRMRYASPGRYRIRIAAGPFEDGGSISVTAYDRRY